ncbi:hypothetical protein [Actinomycetospora termitidis]|uniref:Phage tail protein n=1 Tax=Actinomycetospora termitidis TaxID=3053470 RepID=A0ABT7MFE6_9PSEU|nr:hypothetical protein [Actinomycetospora sp. Odt1-22]MDL5159398.1 hypothetical protein [Actinomycetospora sp. Odt1-22]
MALTLGGLAGDLTWNVRTKGSRWTAAEPRGDNLAIPGRDGSVWRPGKRLDQLSFAIEVWLLGCAPDGSMPRNQDARALLKARYETLLHALRPPGTLTELVDTDTGRRCYAELAGGPDPDTMAGGTRAEVEFDVIVPAGCWEDVTPFTLADTPIANGTTVTVPGAGGSPLPVTDTVITVTGPGRNVRITEPGGEWLAWSGDLPASKLIIDTKAYTAKYQGGTINYLPRVSWSAVPMLPIRAYPGNPALTIAIEQAGGASRINVTGRRRWYTA